jgi:hypothetical protein
MKRISTFLIMLFVIAFSILFIQYRQYLAQHAQTKAEYRLDKRHFLGGFSVDTPERVVNAAADGLQIALLYGFPPSETDSLGRALKAHNMKVIDGVLNSYLSYYECHKLKTCSATIFPELTSVKALLTDVSNHLQQEKNNSLVVGYWVLDDWPPNDLGSAKDILRQENALVHQYTPGGISICGFGTGGIYPAPSYNYSWLDGTAANFSPQGCDMVGLYIYGAAHTTGTYDWTMSKVLPAMFTSLKKRGWDIAKEPLIGIPQAFGGTIGGEPWPVSTAQSIETQSRSFCQNGATGILYYAWDNSGLDNTSQLPWNNTQITQGIRNGISACEQYWSLIKASYLRNETGYRARYKTTRSNCCDRVNQS